METERSPDPERDDDLVVLEGLEAEFTDLESELARVDQSRGDQSRGEGPAEPGS